MSFNFKYSVINYLHLCVHSGFLLNLSSKFIKRLVANSIESPILYLFDFPGIFTINCPFADLVN